jgi:hypothetical protein
VKVDLLHGLDLAGLYETTELGDGLPLLLLALCAATGATTAAASTATVTAALGTATGSKSTSVGHFDCVVGRVRGGLSVSVVVAAARLDDFRVPRLGISRGGVAKLLGLEILA